MNICNQIIIETRRVYSHGVPFSNVFDGYLSIKVGQDLKKNHTFAKQITWLFLIESPDFYHDRNSPVSNERLKDSLGVYHLWLQTAHQTICSLEDGFQVAVSHK